MRKNSMKTALVVTGAACLLAVAAWAGSASPSDAVQQKTAVKKNARKSAAVKIDSVYAVTTIMPQDSMRADSALLAPKLFSLRVVTEPESVSVLLDDSAKGFSPCTLSGVAPGGHVLIFKKSGYYLKKAEITVDSASPLELSFTLLRPAFLRVTSNPPGAVLSIDGTKEGATPYENDKVKPGDHLLKVELKHYTAGERSLTVKSDGRDTVLFTLEHTKAYTDSIETSQRAAEKLRKDRFHFTVVSAIFCLCAILLVIIEANSQ